MKRCKSQKAYLVCMVIMSVFVSILSGCGGGGGGSWTEPGTPGTPVTPGTPSVRPTVVATVPSTATPISIVQPDTDITVTFNKDMARASILAANVFTVTGPASGLVPGAAIPVSYNVATKTATFNPLTALAVGTYTATIKGTGTNFATDTAGNALAGNSALPHVANDYVWRFTVSLAAPVLRPRVSSTAPLTTNPGPTLFVSTGTAVTATFNKFMDALSIKTGTFTLMTGLIPVPPAAIPVTYNATTRTVTFHPLAATLDTGVTYTATIKGTGPDAATDATGNALAGDSTQPAVANDYVWSFITTNVAHLGPLTVDLGLAEPYGVLAGTSITLGGSGVRVDGDVGIHPGSTCNGCDANTVTGVIEVASTNAENAKIALVAAYDDAMGRVLSKCTINGTLTIDPPPICNGGTGSSNGTFTPGLYWSGTSINIPVNGTITLDANNDPTAVFIFQSESTIDSLANSHVILINGADAKNVFWVAKSSSTIGGTTSNFAGTVIALSSITVNTGTNMLGRALARNGDITVQASALITVPPK